ncbi:MAG: hypothetical protein ATN31_00740 [Candidatus Epulonipiscioides saccharophilum]|nr:MAG: hypothetical protein ATN31_00740 [Epulopiscium sp. AS2M-Bin001]
MREIRSLNQGWKYLKHNIHSNGSQPMFYRVDFNDKNWQTVDVPHDSSIVSEFKESNPAGPRGGYAETTLCYYSKVFDLTKEDLAKKIFVEFEGVYMNSTVYINGEELGKYPFGYTTFKYDITDHVVEGSNKLSVMVDNEVQPGSRWYSGTGIYRPVHLYLLDPVHFEKEDFFITTPFITDDYAIVNIDAIINNTNKKQSKFIKLAYEIIDAGGNVVADYTLDKSISYDCYADLSTQIKIDKPQLWSNKTPVLYTLAAKIIENGEVLDNLSIKFGIRSIEFSPDKGFIINGEKEILKGVCIHHDNGPLGSAAHREAFIKKIEIVKAMGANAIRTSHNPESPEFLDLCDEYGMYVMEESFDEWTEAKRPRIFGGIFLRQRIFAYSNYFKEWSEKDLAAMIKRDRNHASIVMWSTGNEIMELKDPEGERLSQVLLNVVHKYDKTRPVLAAGNGLVAINKTHNLDILDLAGYNYAEDCYIPHHEEKPGRCIVGSENASATPFEKRGVYEQFLKVDEVDSILDNDNADPEEAEGFVSDKRKVAETVKTNVRARVARGENSMIRHLTDDFVAGMFIWTGIDYLGEPTPQVWPSISSYFAPIDRICLPKDSFYFYKSCWSDEDVLHLLPHWSFENVEELPVWCYTNCDEVELFVNEKSYGKRSLEPGKQLHLEWPKVKFEKGQLKAVGTRNGQTITTVLNTASDAKHMAFEIDKDTPTGRGKLFYTTVSFYDENDNFVPHQEHEITFSAEDGIEFIVCDNGDPEYSNFTSNSVKTLGGLAKAIFRANASGTICASSLINGEKVDVLIYINVE